MYRDFILHTLARSVKQNASGILSLPLGKNKAANGIGQYLAWKTDEADKEIGDHYALKETKRNQMDEENRASL